MSDDNITEVPPTPGELLTAGREAKGLSLEEVSNTLHILLSNLRAIEEDRFDDVLNGTTFVRGYIRRYAEHLGLDADHIVSIYNSRFAPPETKVAGHVVKKPGRLAKTHMVMPSRSSRKAWKALLSASIVVILVAAIVGVVMQTGLLESVFNSEPEVSSQPALLKLPEEQPVPTLVDPEDEATGVAGETETEQAQEETSALDVAAVVKATEPGVESEPVVLRDRLDFELSGDSWIEVRDASGERLFADLVREGRELRVEGDAPFSVIIGDGRGVALSYNGRPLNYSYARNGYAEITVP